MVSELSREQAEVLAARITRMIAHTLESEGIAMTYSVAAGAILPESVSPSATAVAKPSNLRTVVYSASNMEVYWDATGSSRTQYYTLKLDGVVQALADPLATSAYISGLSSGTSYVLTLTATDVDDVESEALTLTVDTDPQAGGGSPPASVLSPADGTTLTSTTLSVTLPALAAGETAGLWVGSAMDTANLFDSGSLNATTSYDVTVPDDGSAIYARGTIRHADASTTRLYAQYTAHTREVVAGGGDTTGLPASVTQISGSDPIKNTNPPSVGSTVTEQSTAGGMGGTLLRLSGEHHQYATKATFSLAGTHIRTESKIFRLSDGAQIGGNLPFNSESHWSHLDANELIGVSGNTIRRYNYATDTTTTIATISGASSLKIGGGEGGLSANDRRIAVNDGVSIWIVDLQTGSIVSSGSVPSLDACSISVSGDYFVSHDDNPWRVYDADNFSLIDTVGNGRHADLAVDDNGDDVIVSYGQPDGGGSSSTYFGRLCFIRLSDLSMHVVGASSQYADQVLSSAHVSGRCFDLPGWVHVSSGSNGNYSPSERQLMALYRLVPGTTQIEGSSSRYPGGVYSAPFEIKPLGWNRSTSESGTSQYLQQPKASVSFSGRKVAYNTHWNDKLGSGHAFMILSY